MLMRMPSFLAVWATPIGSVAPVVFLPSESSTTSAGARFWPGLTFSPLGPNALCSALTDTLSASPIAVPPCACSESSASLTWVRSVVGLTSSRAAWSKVTSPSRTCLGILPTNCLAALRAAVMRSGLTSVAVIDPDVSVASMIAPCSRVVDASTRGRARAKMSSAVESSSSTAGTWRRQLGVLETTLASRSTLVKRTAYFVRRRCMSTYTAASTGMISSPSRTSGHWKVIAAPVPGAWPAAAATRRGRQHHVVHARVTQELGDLAALLGRRGGEALAQLARAGVGLDLATGLGVDEGEHAHGRELELARVADLDGEHGVAGAQRAQRVEPILRPAEVGDEDDEAAVAGHAAGAAQRRAQRGVAAALGRRLLAQGDEQAEQAGAALTRRQRDRLVAAERVDAEAVGALARQLADDQGHALGDVGLAPVGGAEVHRGGVVDQQPGGQRPLGHGHAHVGLAHARGHVPVDLAHVVARHVRPDGGELDAAADARRAVLAGHDPLDPARQGQIHARSRPAGVGPGPGRSGVRSRTWGRVTRRPRARRSSGGERPARPGRGSRRW